jgi:hypothetical protein
MKAIKRTNNHSPIIVRLICALVVVGVVTCAGSGFAQMLLQSSSAQNSIVQIAAESQGLVQVDPADLPIVGGTYWWVMPGGAAVPTPCLPQDLSGSIFQISPGEFIVDLTGGQVVVPRSSLQTQVASSTVASAVSSQTEALVNLITQLQTASASQQMQTMAMDYSGPPSPGDGGGDGGDTNNYDYSGSYQPQVFTTNDLWLQMFLTNRLGNFVIHSPNIAAFDIFATTNLIASVPGLNGTNWVWLLRTDVGETNNIIVTNLWSDLGFFRLGTMQDSDNDGLTDAYERLVNHTDPQNWSSANDGVSDGWKVAHGISPYTYVSGNGLSAAKVMQVFTPLQ